MSGVPSITGWLKDRTEDIAACGLPKALHAVSTHSDWLRPNCSCARRHPSFVHSQVALLVLTPLVQRMKRMRAWRYSLTPREEQQWVACGAAGPGLRTFQGSAGYNPQLERQLIERGGGERWGCLVDAGAECRN